MALDVFRSYRSEDKAEAERLCSGLEGNGIPCWMAPRNIPIGTEWPAAIVEAIGACKVFVMVLSSNLKNENQISREAELADKQGCQIITFRIEDVPPPGLAYFLGNIQWQNQIDNGYYCDYTLMPEGGRHLANKIWLIRNREGKWSVSRSELKRIAKS